MGYGTKRIIATMDTQKIDNLIIASNREPYTYKRSKTGIVCEKNIGGLVSSIDATMRSGLWIAWGSSDADFLGGQKIDLPPEHPRYSLKRIRLTKAEIDNYYHGFSNSTLWPIFHQFIEKAVFDDRYWNSYKRVNLKFAKAVIEEIKEESLIWVHDYHLSLLPKSIRNEYKDAKIAIFWHIPWVHWDTFNDLPQREEIFEGILGADLVGFHTRSYVQNFIECAKNLGFIVDERKKTINTDDRVIKVKSFPIGIDYHAFSEAPRYLTTRKKSGKIIFGIDRLDYTKGILNRLFAFERFLEKYPEFTKKVTLIQATSPSRTRVEEYRSMKREIDENVGRINGRYETMDWTPIRYFYRRIPQKTLLRYYMSADVALITPLIDGMNVIVKEYIATNDLGVAILSEFTGAAEELKEAIIVNPYDVDEVADAIKIALEMPEKEKRERFTALKERIRKKDINWWFKTFFDSWREIYAPSV